MSKRELRLINTHLTFILLSILVSLGLAVETKGSDAKLSIAITPFESHGLDPSEASTLTDALSSHLASSGNFRVLERGRMDMILKEQGFQQTGACSDQACVVEMGQLLGVDHIVTGSIGKVGKTYSVNARTIKVSSGEIVKTVSKYYKGEIDGLLTDIMPVVATELASLNNKVPETIVKKESAPSATKSDNSGIKEDKKGGHTGLWIGVGVVVLGGGAAAFAILSKDKSTNDNKTPTSGVGSAEVTW